MSRESVDAYLDALQTARAEILAWEEAHDTTFREYHQRVATYNEILQLAIDETRAYGASLPKGTVLRPGWRISRPTTYRVDHVGLRNRCPEVLDAYPALVTAVDATVLEKMHPGLFCKVPEVVQGINCKQLVDLVGTGLVPKAVEEFITENNGVTITAPKPLVTRL